MSVKLPRMPSRNYTGRHCQSCNSVDVCTASLPVCTQCNLHSEIHTCFTAPFRDYQVSRYQKGKTSLDFTVARDSEWQWHQLGHMQVCTSLQTDNHASTPPLSFLQAGCPSCRPTNSVKALKAQPTHHTPT